LDGHIFNESEMALFFECMLQCAQKCLTPPTLLERRYFNNRESWAGLPFV
jgi:hypothetical protein